MTLRLEDIRLILSVQHTGTWKVLRFLNKFIPTIKELPFMLETDIKAGAADVMYEHTYEHPLIHPTLVHTHLPIEHGRDSEPNNSFKRKWYLNLEQARSLPVQTLLLFCNFFKTVIPVRDPFASLLSREVRHPQFRHFCIVDGFISLAREFSRHPNVMFFPIDLYDDYEGRLDLLKRLMAHCGLSADEHIAILEQEAREWNVENDTPQNFYKELYAAGDIDQIRFLLGPKWAEVRYLINMSAILIPWLASIGYTRDKIYRGL